MERQMTTELNATGVAPLVELDGVAYSCRTGSGPVKALKRASGGFRRGHCYAIVGRSGSGKSTLLSLMAGLGRRETGTIRFEGRSLADLDRDG